MGGKERSLGQQLAIALLALQLPTADAFPQLEASKHSPEYSPQQQQFPRWYHAPDRGFRTITHPAVKGLKQAEQPDIDALRKTASSFMMEEFGVVDGQFKRTAEFQSPHNGIYHYYCRMKFNNLTVANAVANVNVDKYGRVVSSGGSWPDMKSLRDDTPAPNETISATDAFVRFANTVNLPIDRSQLGEFPPAPAPNGDGSEVVTLTGIQGSRGEAITATKKYYRSEEALHLVWNLRVPLQTHYYNAQVSASNGTVLALMDWAAREVIRRQSDLPLDTSFPTISDIELQPPPRKEALLPNFEGLLDSQQFQPRGESGLIPNVTYRAIPIGGVKNLEGGDVRQLIINPYDPDASPLGWHKLSNKDGEPIQFDGTAGNNVIAQTNYENRTAPEPNFERPEGTGFLFDFTVDDSKQQPAEYANASITNAFFVANRVHDILYQYGFDERAGNFQNDNFGRGGEGNDAIILDVQVLGEESNAVFLPSPDGEPGRLSMGVFAENAQKNGGPPRDSAFENGIIIHELGHGINSRLTGGASNPNCLDAFESAGMDEGWADFLALNLQTTENDSHDRPVTIGTYVMATPAGIRNFPFSTNLEVNPHKYSSLQQQKVRDDPHNVGEVWTAMLWEVYWNLIDKLGFERDIANARSRKGNTLMLQLVIDGMKLQPCNPTFIQARDAIIQADQLNNNGANQCDIWAGFAKRGLGLSANRELQDAFDVPAQCEGVPVGAAARQSGGDAARTSLRDGDKLQKKIEKGGVDTGADRSYHYFRRWHGKSRQ